MCFQLLLKGLAQATDIILTGGSAGGLTAYLQADHVAARLTAAGVPKISRFAALGDAGFFLDHLAWDGRDVSRSEFSYAFNMWNSTTGVNDACIAANSVEPWKCIFAQYTLPHIAADFFVAEGAYDSWQLGNVRTPRGSPLATTTCTWSDGCGHTTVRVSNCVSRDTTSLTDCLC